MTKIEPICRNDREPLERLDGLWAFSQVKNEPDNTIAYTGTVYTVTLWRCPKCGALEAIDEGAST